MITLTEEDCQSFQRRGFPVLPGPVDGKVFPVIDQLFYFRKASLDVNHVMELGIAGACGIKASSHMWHTPSGCSARLIAKEYTTPVMRISYHKTALLSSAAMKSLRPALL